MPGKVLWILPEAESKCKVLFLEAITSFFYLLKINTIFPTTRLNGGGLDPTSDLMHRARKGTSK